MKELTKENITHAELIAVLKNNGVSNVPAYSGFGIEVYQNLDNETQVIANFINHTLVVRKGFE